MPKHIIVDPAKERKPGKLAVPEIPLCQYATPLAQELQTYGKAALLGVYEDMLLIREFEVRIAIRNARVIATARIAVCLARRRDARDRGCV